VGVLRGEDPLLMIDLLVGEILVLIPISSAKTIDNSYNTNNKNSVNNNNNNSFNNNDNMQASLFDINYSFDCYHNHSSKGINYDTAERKVLKEEEQILCKIMTIDLSANGRKAWITIHVI
jgi:hypothetical protein